MTMTPRVRWALYAAAALVLVVLVLLAPPADDGTVQPVRRSAAPGGPVSTATTATTADGGLTALRTRPAQPPLADPFATQGAIETNDSGPVIRSVATAPEAPRAPPLPFSYLGRWQEQGRSYVFLQRDGRSFKISGPGALDGEYAVQSIDERRIAFTYLPLGIVQDLRLDAPAPAAQGNTGAAPAAEPPSVPEEGN